ncbi:MAG: hypothetical protein IJ748_04190 [Bacteroidales bacterium]|nr:hypothetical protein [Bacteroidales bacterium]
MNIKTKTFMFASMFLLSLTVFGQKADAILGMKTTQVNDVEYRDSFFDTFKNKTDILLLCYVNEPEYYNSYFTSWVKRTSPVSSKILSDLKSNKTDDVDLKVFSFDKGNSDEIIYTQMYLLKRDYVVAVLNDGDAVKIVAYSQKYYKEKVLK